MTALVANKKPDGRSREARAARAAEAQANTMSIDGDEGFEGVTTAAPQRQAPRQSVRDAMPRQPSREPARAGEVVGRNGEVLTRKRTGVGDPFHIPDNLIERGWEMQWIAVSVVGNTEIVMDQNLAMLENGWRPVQASQFPGRFMPAGYSGHIVRGGQGLYERPKALCDAARSEDVRMAKQLVSDRNDSLKLSGVKNAMPDGFAMSNKYRGAGGNIKMSIDPALDIEAPGYTLAESGE